MQKLQTLFAVAAVSLLSACSNTPQKGGDTGEGDIYKDTAPGIEDDKNASGIEVIGAGQGGELAGQNISGKDLTEGSDSAGMQMVDVDTIYEPVIYFAYDQYSLDDAATQNIRFHADKLLANPSQKVILKGHTDERGTPEYNLALGERRAKAVEEAMMLFGVAQSRIEVISYGEEQPADANSNEAAWAKNRRVEMIIK